MTTERLTSWSTADVRPKVVEAAAKHLHLRGYSGVNMAELDEAVRLTIGQSDCDPFADGSPRLDDLFTSKHQIFLAFLEPLLNDALTEAFEGLDNQIKTMRPGETVDAVHIILHGGVDKVLRRLQSFRLLLAGAVAEGFSLRRFDLLFFTETRRIAHTFFAGLLGFWKLPGEVPDDDLVDWSHRRYSDKHADAVAVLRQQLDTPLDPEQLVEGLYLIYGGAIVWWLMGRTADPSEPTRLIADLSVLTAGGLRKLNGTDDSFLRRALQIEKRFRDIHVAEPLRRIVPKRHLDNLWARLLSVAYGEVPRRIQLINGIR